MTRYTTFANSTAQGECYTVRDDKFESDSGDNYYHVHLNVGGVSCDGDNYNHVYLDASGGSCDGEGDLCGVGKCAHVRAARHHVGMGNEVGVLGGVATGKALVVPLSGERELKIRQDYACVLRAWEQDPEVSWPYLKFELVGELLNELDRLRGI